VVEEPVRVPGTRLVVVPADPPAAPTSLLQNFFSVAADVSPLKLSSQTTAGNGADSRPLLFFSTGSYRAR
jgi:hypothetical protein